MEIMVFDLALLRAGHGLWDSHVSCCATECRKARGSKGPPVPVSCQMELYLTGSQLPPYFRVVHVCALRDGSTFSMPHYQLRTPGRRQEGPTEPKCLQDSPAGAQPEPSGADSCGDNWNQRQACGEDQRCLGAIELDLKFVLDLP